MLCIMFLSSLALCNTYLIFSCIRRSDLHPSPAPHFETFKVFLIYFAKCPCFTIIQISHMWPNWIYVLMKYEVFIKLMQTWDKIPYMFEKVFDEDDGLGHYCCQCVGLCFICYAVCHKSVFTV